MHSVFCHSTFWWIYYCRGNKSAWKETGKMHLCAMVWSPFPKNDAKISPLCICQNDNLEMIQLVSTEHEKMDDENPRNNLLTRIKSMRHGSNGSVRASGRTGTTNSSIVSGQAHRCRPCLFVQILSKVYPRRSWLKVAFFQKVRCVFQPSKKNIPNHYPELEI